MGRRHNHRSGWGRPLVSLATLALLGTGAWLLAPHSQWLLERAALVSAAATMPDGLWDRLAQRFAGQLEEATGLELDEEDCGTFTGLVFHLLGNVPKDGDQEIRLELPTCSLLVTRIENHQVAEATVQVKPNAETAEE